MESFNFITPSRVKVLLVPLGPICASDFDNYCKLVNSVADVRLLDISPIPSCANFNPQTFPQGRIFFSFSSSLSDIESTFLEDFEPFRKTFLVLGLGIYQSSHSQENDFLLSLKSQFPTAISHNLIICKSPESCHDQANVFYLSNQAEQIITSIETIACGFSRNFLIALDAYASSYESITLRSPVSLTDGSMLTRTIKQAQRRISSGSSFKVSFANGQTQTTVNKDSKLKSSQRQSGRQAKLMGNFYLLAGKTHDAFQYFTDAAINSRKADDHLWLASSLEGLAVSILILSFLGEPYQIQNPMLMSLLSVTKSKGLSAHKSSSKSSMDSTISRNSGIVSSPRNSTSSLPTSTAQHASSQQDFSALQHLDILLLLTSRSSLFYSVSATDVEDCVPDLVYVESLMRNIKLMVTIHLSGSVDSAVINRALIGLEPIKNPKKNSQYPYMHREIVSEIDKVFALQLSQLDVTKQCQIYCALASVYRDLGFRRKQAFVLRLLLLSLKPEVSLREKDSEATDPRSLGSIRNIFEMILSIYQINKETEISSVMAYRHYSDWVVLQLSLLKICLKIAESLQDYQTLAKLCTLTLLRFTHCLPAEDQLKLRDKLTWSSLFLDRDNSEYQTIHPDLFMVRDAKFIVSSESLNMVSLTSRDEQQITQFYDPFKKANTNPSLDRIICANDIHHLKVVLQNPFSFNLDLHNIVVVAKDGFKIETVQASTIITAVSSFHPSSDQLYNSKFTTSRQRRATSQFKPSGTNNVLTVPSTSFAELVIPFRALEAGKFEIIGFNIVVGQGDSQFFSIVNAEKNCDKKKVTDMNSLHTKHVFDTIDSLARNLHEVNIQDRVSTKCVSLSAVPAQPNLYLTRNSATSGWLMLLEGETENFDFELKNSSKEVVNYLSFALWDSSSDYLNAKLNSSIQSGLSPEEVYELEWSLVNKAAINVTNKSEISSKNRLIQPGGTVKIDYSVFGKRALSEAKLILEYGRKRLDDENDIYVKILTIPLRISVHRSLEVVGNDIVGLSPTTLQISKTGDFTEEETSSLLAFFTRIKMKSQENISGFCLLVFDVRNFWKDTLRAEISNVYYPDTTYSTCKEVRANETARFLVPVKRIGVKDFDMSAPIPSLRNKQYVKNQNMSEDEENQMRLSHWTKSEVLKGLRGTWNTVATTFKREGEIDLRRLRLNPIMTKSLVHDSISIHQTVFSDGANSEEVEKKNNGFILEREKFYILRTKIINHTNGFLSGTLRHVPFPVNASSKQDLSIDQKILYDGVLQIPLKKDQISPCGSVEFELGFMILEKGDYEWGSIFDEANDVGKRIIGRDPAYITAL